MALRRFAAAPVMAVLVAMIGWLPLYPEGLAAIAQDTTGDQQVSEAAVEPPAPEAGLDFLNLGTTPTSVIQLREMERRIEEVYEKVKPATVNIQLDGSQGTGVVVSRDGLILTAAHVITGPHRLATITFPDGKQVKARTLGVNRPADSGMLKIVGDETWPYVDLGESESLNNGQWVVAIGHPGGIDMDRGLVVRVGRVIFKSDQLLRTDCTLVGGDSGGPLVDMDGYLIGIHSRIGNSLNDNLHVAVDMYSTEWDQLEEGEIIGVPARPYIGLNVVDDTNEVESVNPGGPADEAGIKPGDRIVKIGEAKIEKKADINEAFSDIEPDQRITIVVTRPADDESKEDETLTLELNVGRR